jgi:hypothetical protein
MRRVVGGMGDGYVKKHMAGMQCSMSMMEKKSM